MNILCISHEYPPVGGGGATACLNICKLFAEMGHHVVILTSAYLNTPSFEMVDGVEIHRVKSKRSSKDHSSFGEMLSFLVAAFKKVPLLIKSDKFDICHIYFGIPSGPLGWYIKKRWGIPYIVRLGGGDVPGTQKRFDKVYKLIGPFLKVIWKQADYVVANSQGICERAKAFSPNAQFVVIPNGIDPADFCNIQKTKPDDRFRVVTTARIIERKGIQHVIEAMPELIKLTNGKILYTIIGDGPYRPEIEQLAHQLGVSEHIEITGMIERSRVLLELAKSDVFVLTSHWEGMPNVVLEAMAVGLSIVMTNCEGSKELVKDNGMILSLEAPIVPQLINAIQKLMDPCIAKQCSQNSISLAIQTFTWANTTQAYMELFEQCV